MTRIWLAIVSLIILIAIGIGVWFYVTLPAVPVKDEIASWQFTGPYKDGGVFEGVAKAEITELEKQLGKSDDVDAELYIAIASQYELLGEGKAAYNALNKAIKSNPTNGLAYANLARLMETLGAYETARMAYDKAVEVNPGEPEYQKARAEFIARRFPTRAP